MGTPTTTEDIRKDKAMGYCAESVEIDLVIPAGNVAAALAAVGGDTGTAGEPADKLAAAVEDRTGFECEVSNAGDFVLSWHHDKWLSATEKILEALAPFAVDGSYVRLRGEDDSQFGFRVVGTTLRTEYGVTDWRLEGEA